MHLDDIVPPDPADGWGLFFDIDGTLIDIAPTPDGVTVPPRLKDDLAQLYARMGGALALVTGRALPDADRLFAPLTLPIAGLHGADIRFADGRLCEIARDPALDRLRHDLRELLAPYPDLILEDKGAGIGVHFRSNPGMKEQIVTRLEQFVAAQDGRFAVQHGLMVAEVRPAAASKAHAVERFLAEPAFLGRKPIAFGDDLTDESMFAAVRRHGGMAIRVGRHGRPTAAEFAMPDAASVRDWIGTVAARHG